jgi:hypothetical protein
MIIEIQLSQKGELKRFYMLGKTLIETDADGGMSHEVKKECGCCSYYHVGKMS